MQIICGYDINQIFMVLLIYDGSIYLNLASNVKDIRNEYDNTIKLMNGKLHSISIIESCNFIGFRSFDAMILSWNAKAFMRNLTANECTTLHQWKYRICNMATKTKHQSQ